jgi:hypothetical protein
MNKLLAAATVLLVFTCGFAFADQGKHGKFEKMNLACDRAPSV